MAISLNLNHHSPFNALENLKPRITKEPNDNGNKTGDKNNAKADTQETKVAINNEVQQSLLNISPIDKAHNSLANVMLRVLVDAMENGYNEYANSMIESMIQNSKLPASSANAPGGSKGGIYVGSIFNTASVEFTQSITYALNYHHQSGEYSQSLAYSSSFVTTFNAEFTDKVGNKIKTQNQLALGKNLENQITKGQESLSSALKSLLEGQTFKVDFDGDFNELGKDLQNGLNRNLYLFESIGDSLAKALQETKTPKDNYESLLSNLQSALHSNLEMFVGIPKENQNTPALQDWLQTSNSLTITASYAEYSAQWIGKKLNNSESGIWFYGSIHQESASFKFEA